MMMHKLFGVIAWIFLILSALSLAVFAVGTFGLFGSEATPFAPVFLAILGQPWVRLVDFFPPSFIPWATAAAPLLNAGILFLIARLFKSV
jgi:hypothetical protein